ncbi:Uncharacterized protein TCM_008149 [Theobroma cacao]|uniref:Receptor ligand binding region domain-containing protein n=1 Tax=Theobroma cacao TaxID=3641 RepID=A0A061E3D1_THECC|nr:Uncharacterized protein TCM_008149 [Theobroma cacao]
MLNKLMAKQTKVILVHMTSSLGSDLFLLVKEAGMNSEGYAWIITDGLSSLLDPMGARVLGSMKGVLGIRPYVLHSKSLEKFKRKWKSGIHFSSTKLNIFGFWAYDTVWALAMAVEMVRHDQSSSVIEQNYNRNASQFPDIRVSKIERKIRNRLLHTTFKGLNGDFNLVKGQLQFSAFEIINVVDSDERAIGYWTPENGYIGQLRKPGKVAYSTSMYELKPPIWPGNTKVRPKVWSIPINGKKLNLALMHISKWNEILTPTSPSYQVQECIINELLSQVNLQSHVSMVVKIEDDKKKNKRIFLKPLSWDLWLTTRAAFICTDLVIWVLEHRINNEFRGPPQQQEEDNEQCVKMYTYYLDLCGTHPHPKLHRKLNFNVNSATIRTRFLRERPFGKAIVFDESKLKNYGTTEEAFPQGSPLVAYTSRAILNVTEDKAKMDAMEQKCFSRNHACENQDTAISSDSLSVYSFEGLFIITRMASVSSLIIYVSKFL